MDTQSCYPDKAPVVDAVLDILGHHLRREIVVYFENDTSAETATFDELVTHVDQQVPLYTREEIHLRLLHAHLPKLVQANWLTYDARDRDIRYHGHADAQRLLNEVADIF